MPSSLDAARAAIETRIDTEWAGATPVAWEGVDFSPPDGPWIQPRVIWGDAFEDSMVGPSGARNRIVGVLSTNLFAKPGTGKGALLQLADAFRDLFNRADLGGVRFGAPSAPRPVPSRGEGQAWMQVNVSVPFEVEELV